MQVANKLYGTYSELQHCAPAATLVSTQRSVNFGARGPNTMTIFTPLQHLVFIYAVIVELLTHVRDNGNPL